MFLILLKISFNPLFKKRWIFASLASPNRIQPCCWLLLSRFSRIRLCETPQTAAHQAVRPWDSPGKNTGVGCHFLLQCMKAKSESEVAQSCPTPSNLMDCSLPGPSVHGIFQARVLEWVAIAFSDPALRDVQRFYHHLLQLLLGKVIRIRLPFPLCREGYFQQCLSYKSQDSPSLSLLVSRNTRPAGEDWVGCQWVSKSQPTMETIPLQADVSLLLAFCTWVKGQAKL